jgi:hypothetical protein
MIFISVLLPAPFSPTRPWISPAESAKSTPRALGLFHATVSAAALGRLRHHQLRSQRVVVQIFDAEADGLARTCPSDRGWLR